VANRGEIAIRVLRAAADLGIPSVAIASADDAESPHRGAGDEVAMLAGEGPRAYLDIDAILAAASQSGCDALHPGYGFLAENPALARRCEQAGVRFVGPRAETLETLGNKLKARAVAEKLGIPVLPGADNLAEAQSLLASLGSGAALMVKAVSGGGGRGLRRVDDASELAAAWERCASEAELAFGHGAVFAEQLLRDARHIEIQIVGDSQGNLVALGERECSLQRRNQKLLEIAPSPSVSAALRTRLSEAALKLAGAVGTQSLATFEFLVDAAPEPGEPSWAFMEANPRIQVEHTVTEEVFGIDLVHTQLQLADGASLESLGLAAGPPSPARGYALQVRINIETLQADGSIRPSSGTVTHYAPPTGPGIRVDGAGHAGYCANPRFDSLLAKLIVHSPSADFGQLVRRAERALGEFQIEGVATNLELLRALLAHADVRANAVTTTFFEAHLAELLADTESRGTGAASATTGLAGARLATDDPLAVLDHGKSARPGVAAAAATAPATPAAVTAPPGTQAVQAPLQGTIVSVDVRVGESVHQLQPLLVMEAMKMEHVIVAECSGIVRALGVAPGDTVFENHPLVFLEPAEVEAPATAHREERDLDRIRPDLVEVQERHAFGLDDARPDAVARRRKTGQRTARENVDDLCDPGTFIEYGPLAIAAQRRRRDLDDLIRETPADGMITGVGSVNGEVFASDAARCAILSYDYTVLAGTQGLQNHRKKDRLFEVAEQSRLPLVLFSEGGGGRPGDTDGSGVAGLDCRAFQYFGRLSGLVPLVGINSGRCFAGNAVLL
ncbi:MAG: biotin carboxylase N-terminal domain-containing protein, partial [Myxococcota bacterium]